MQRSGIRRIETTGRSVTTDEALQVFFQECDEGLAALASCIRLCRENRHDDLTLAAMCRVMQSIGGGAGAFGKDALRQFAQALCCLLDLVRRSEAELSPDLLGDLTAALEMLSAHILAAEGGGEAPDDSRLRSLLSARLANAGEDEDGDPRRWQTAAARVRRVGGVLRTATV